MRRMLAGALVSGFLAACSSAPQAAEPVVLRVLMADDWATVPVIGEVIEDFEDEHPGVRVNLQGSPFSQIPDLVTSAIDLGQPHDLAHWHAFAAAAAGLAEPLDDLWDEAGLDPADYLPGAFEGVSWRGSVYGVPLDTNALVLLVNRDLLDDASVDDRELATFEGFREAATDVVAGSDADHAIVISGSSWAAYGWIVANGGELIEMSDSGPVRFTFDDPETVEAMELLVDLVRSGESPPALAPDLATDAVASFADGGVAMHASGSWDLPIARRAMQAEFDVDNIGVLPLPQDDPSRPRTVLGGSSLFVPRDAPNAELAFELALALTADDVALRLAEQEGRLPAQADVFDHELFRSSEDLAAFVEQLPNAEVMPLIAFPEIAAAFRDGLDDLLAERSTPKAALGQVQAYADRWLEENG